MERVSVQKRRTQIKSVLLNAFLLLIPTFIFIVVKVDTAKKTIDWNLENILYYFILYALMLSVFTFQPHVVLMQTRTSKSLIAGSQSLIELLTHSTYFYLGLGIFFVVFPFLVSLYQIKIFILMFIYLIFALGLNYTVGFTGLLNLGHVLPFAAGAYTYGLLFKYATFSFLPSAVLGLVSGGVVGLLIALVTIRLRGDYLAIVTLALAEIFKILAKNIDSITNGARGIAGIPLPLIPGLQLGLKSRYILLYYIAGVVVLLAIIVAVRLVKSRFGRAWEANREDIIAAESSGINLKKTRLTVFLIGGCYAGIAGVIQAASSTYIDPNISGILYSITVLSIVVLGGMGSVRGIMLGTVIVILLPEYLRSFSQYRMLLYGALLVVMMQYRQRGLLPQKRESYDGYVKELEKNA